MAFIYKIANTENTKLYVGQTRATLQKRLAWHVSLASCKNYGRCAIASAMNKYGKEKFIMIAIEELPKDCAKEQLDSREVYWGTVLNALAPNGYSLRLGGSNGLMSDESRRKMSISHTGKKLSEEHKRKTAEANRGQKRTEEQKKRMSEIQKNRSPEEKAITFAKASAAHMGRKFSEETKKKMSDVYKNYTEQQKIEKAERMRKINLGRKLPKERIENCTRANLKYYYKLLSPDGEIFETNNLCEFCRFKGINPGHMWRVIDGKLNHHKKWTAISKTLIKKKENKND